MSRLTMLRNRAPPASLARVQPLTTAADRIVAGSSAHRQIKRLVAKRSQGWCECTTCRQSGSPLPAQEYDHVVPLWEGGGNELGNWQHLNRDCHKAKTALEHRRRLGID